MAEQHNNSDGNMRNTEVLLRCAVDPQNLREVECLCRF